MTSLLMLSSWYLTDGRSAMAKQVRRPPIELCLYARGPLALRAPGMGPSET
jgi:hypothetical protein